jgi:hypothetical protein
LNGEEKARRESRARAERLRQAMVELAQANRPLAPHLGVIDATIHEMERKAQEPAHQGR